MDEKRRRWPVLWPLAVVLLAGAVATALVMAFQARRWLGSLETRTQYQSDALMRLGASSSTPPNPASLLPEDWAPGGKLAIRLNERPVALNPLLVRDAGARAVCDLVCEPLARRDLDSLEFRPALAARWQVAADGLAYIFHLDPKARFSDGQPVTADDVVFTFELLRDERICGRPGAALLADLKDVQVLDPLTVRFRFDRPYFLALPAVADRYIVPRHVYAFADARKWQEAETRDLLVGSGPYLPEKRIFSLSDDIVLKRNEGYWNRARIPALDEIEFRVVEDDVRALQLLKTGGLDMLCLSPEQYREIEADKNFLKYHHVFRYYSPARGALSIGWNTTRPPTDDVRLRRALAMLAPRQRIVEQIYMGLGRAVDAPFWSGGPQYPHGIAVTPFDPRAAEVLLDDAGWRLDGRQGKRVKNGRPLRIELLTPKREERLRTIGDDLAEEARKIGVDVSVRHMAWPDIQDRVASRDFDALVLAWTGAVEVDPYLFWHSSQTQAGGLNLVGFASSEADRLTAAIRGELDPGRRNQLCASLAELLSREQPCTMLLEPETLVAIRSRFAGVGRYRLGLRPQEWYIPRQLR